MLYVQKYVFIFFVQFFDLHLRFNCIQVNASKIPPLKNLINGKNLGKERETEEEKEITKSRLGEDQKKKRLAKCICRSRQVEEIKCTFSSVPPYPKE